MTKFIKKNAKVPFELPKKKKKGGHFFIIFWGVRGARRAGACVDGLPAVLVAVLAKARGGGGATGFLSKGRAVGCGP